MPSQRPGLTRKVYQRPSKRVNAALSDRAKAGTRLAGGKRRSRLAHHVQLSGKRADGSDYPAPAHWSPAYHFDQHDRVELDNQPVSGFTFAPGDNVDVGLLRHWVDKLKARFHRPSHPVQVFLPWQFSSSEARAKSVPDGYVGRCFGIIHLEHPDHYVSITWKGGRNFNDVIVSDSLGDRPDRWHMHLSAALYRIGVREYSVHVGALISHDTHSRTCAICVCSDLIGILKHDSWTSLMCLHPSDYKTDELLDAAIERLITVRRYVRPASEAIRPVEDDDVLPEGFAKGTLCLRRVPMTPEAAGLLTSSKEIQGLLTLPYLILPTNPDVLKGVSDGQRRKHLYILLDVIKAIQQSPPDLTAPTDLVLVTALQSLSTERNWTAPTTIQNAAEALFGALTRLPQYTNLPAIRLLGSPHWKDAMKTWNCDALGHAPKDEEVTLEAFHRLMTNRSLSQAARMVLLVAWLHTGRPGNAFGLHTSEVTNLARHPSDQTAKWTVQWNRAKTVATRGAYVTYSWLQAEYLADMDQWLEAKRGGTANEQKWFVPLSQKHAIMKELGTALRSENPEWGLRALRRGALSTLARNGVPLSVIILFSGHTNEKMLSRYLRYGLHVEEKREKGAMAARAAFQAAPPSAPKPSPAATGAKAVSHTA